MKNKWKITAAATLVAAGAQAQTAFVTIGDPGNAADPASYQSYDSDSPYGAVDYTYEIDKYEISVLEFHNADVSDGNIGSGNEEYWQQEGAGWYAPAVNVTIYEAMKYCNYLTTTNSDQGYYISTDGGETYAPRALSHDAYAAINGTTYFVPTRDEWHKAAYYTGNSGDEWSLYADGTDTAPTASGTGATGWNYVGLNGGTNVTRQVIYGTVEQNYTYNMMGNVGELTEDVVDGNLYTYGGSFGDDTNGVRAVGLFADEPDFLEMEQVGFRIVRIIPEPASIAMIGVLGGCALFIRRIFLI